MLSTDTVVTEVRDETLIVTINRPEVRNAVDAPTADVLYATFQAFDDDPDLAVAILTGADGAFCAGADLKAISDDRGNRIEQRSEAEIIDSLGPMGPTRLDLSKPVIAAIEGHAVAGGLELAVWCDMRVMADDATLGVYCRRWGVPLVDGGTVRLPRLVGHGRAMDLILTGRAVDAAEAHAIGLVDRVCSPSAALDVAVDLAASIAAFPQRCMRSDRRSAIDQWGQDLSGALAQEITLGLDTVRSGETRLGAGRFAGGAGRHGSFGD